MRQIISSALFFSFLVLFPAATMAKEFVLSDAEAASRIDEWSVSSADIGIAADPPFSVKKSMLHGGKQEGVELIEVDNGRTTISVIPTRGMNVFRVRSGDVTLGWNSPVKQIVNPAFIELDSRGGLGWLDGFNEMLVRCGFEWAGHPGMDNGKLLTLHGRAGNTPASKVVVVIDDQPPHRIHVRGKVDEQVFKFADYEVWTELSTEPGSRGFRISDTLTNRGDYEREFQIIYHGNFGPPLLAEGSKFEAPAKQVTPFNDYAAKDVATWPTYRAPTRDFDEQVYNFVLFADPNGLTTVMLRNKAGDRGRQAAVQRERTALLHPLEEYRHRKAGLCHRSGTRDRLRLQPQHRTEFRTCSEIAGRRVTIVHPGLHDPADNGGCRGGQPGNRGSPRRSQDPGRFPAAGRLGKTITTLVAARSMSDRCSVAKLAAKSFGRSLSLGGIDTAQRGSLDIA